jgi:hypothetical protein
VPKKLLASTIFLSMILVSVVSTLCVEVVDANPVPWSTTPNIEKPALTVISPQNYTTYNADSLYLNFTAIKPDSWNAIYIVVPYVGQMYSADVYVDGSLISHYGYSGSAFVKFNQSTPELNQTAPGEHTLNVTVLSYTYYRGPAFNGSHILSSINSSSGPVYEYPIVVSDIVYFTVEQPTQNANAPGSVYLLNQTNLILIAFLILIVAVASISLIYFKKHKPKTESDKKLD